MEEQALFCRLNELPRLRQILQELLEMVNQNDVDFGELTRKISMEQVLSARLLRLANSAHFWWKPNCGIDQRCGDSSWQWFSTHHGYRLSIIQCLS